MPEIPTIKLPYLSIEEAHRFIGLVQRGLSEKAALDQVLQERKRREERSQT